MSDTTPSRPSFENVVADLATKSDKIRALARAGYLRTEIAERLGIRYQHVRKVLVDAGISDGLTREVSFERTPVIVETEDTPPTPTSWELLLNAGFTLLGEWRLSNETKFFLDAKAPSCAGVYAFVVDDVVKYVGLTQRGFDSRLDGYRRGYEKQKTNARVNRLIVEALTNGQQVKVLIVKPDSLEWNGLPINTAAGLEAGLITLIQPEWNVMGVG